MFGEGGGVTEVERGGVTLETVCMGGGRVPEQLNCIGQQSQQLHELPFPGIRVRSPAAKTDCFGIAFVSLPSDRL